MAGFFKNYQKPGKGVSKDESDKKGFFLFFELLWRKLFQLIGLNILYFIVIMPLCAFLTAFVLQSVGIGEGEVEPNMLLMILGYVMELPEWLSWSLIIVSAALYGPATAGLTYVLRNYARREPVFPFSDAFQKAKENLKQGFAAGVIDIFLVISCAMYLAMDQSAITAGQGYMVFFKYAAIVIFILYIIMRFYIYAMIVTFRMKFTAILKNAWLFIVIGFLKNIYVIVFSAVVIFLSISATAMTFPLITFTLCYFITVFNVFPVIEKYMIAPIGRQKGNVEIKSEDEAIFKDDV